MGFIFYDCEVRLSVIEVTPPPRHSVCCWQTTQVWSFVFYCQCVLPSLFTSPLGIGLATPVPSGLVNRLVLPEDLWTVALHKVQLISHTRFYNQLYSHSLRILTEYCVRSYMVLDYLTSVTCYCYFYIYYELSHDDALHSYHSFELYNQSFPSHNVSNLNNVYWHIFWNHFFILYEQSFTITKTISSILQVLWKSLFS